MPNLREKNTFFMDKKTSSEIWISASFSWLFVYKLPV